MNSRNSSTYQKFLDLPKRRAWIEISDESEDDSTEKYFFNKLEGLNIRFQVQSSRSGTQPRATISICNLNQNDMQRLINYYGAAGIKKGNYKVIRLFAGYDDNVRKIFEGSPLNYLVSSPPDVWLSLECVSTFLWNVQSVKFSTYGVFTVKEISDMIASQLGVTLRYTATTQKTIQNPHFDGSGQQAVREYLQNIDSSLWVYLTTEFLFVADKGMQKNVGNTWEINKKTGLIGVPQIEPFGATFTTLLNPEATCFDKVKLESTIVNAPDRELFPSSIIHVGELRGGAFYTQWKCYWTTPNGGSSK